MSLFIHSSGFYFYIFINCYVLYFSGRQCHIQTHLSLSLTVFISVRFFRFSSLIWLDMLSTEKHENDRDLKNVRARARTRSARPPYRIETNTHE